ncbi:MAG: metallophosphoesterase, partial [Pirellulales bacterium]|nr:metallophosphoesterase [Pirellulales bacterium]
MRRHDLRARRIAFEGLESRNLLSAAPVSEEHPSLLSACVDGGAGSPGSSSANADAALRADVATMMGDADATADSPELTTTTFAVIGDYGSGSTAERDVANLVKSWNPDFVITVGDNNYNTGSAAAIDANIGQFYHEFIGDYSGSYGAGSPTNRFFPSLGNHDWGTTSGSPAVPTPYLDYFTLPGNERYYTFTQGPVEFFVIDSDSHEPDGITSTSLQAQWLQSELAGSTAAWKLVYFHHAPYSSGSHGNTTTMQWPFAAWGATAVLAGHDHLYERLEVGGLPYFVNGSGGKSLYSFGTPVAGSKARYNADYGAMRVDATDSTLIFQFINRQGMVIDTLTLDSAPTADIVDVMPDPRTIPVSQITIAFSEPVSGFDLPDLQLTRDGGANLLTGSQTLTTSDNKTWQLGNLSGLTGTAGNYTLSLKGSGSGIVDMAGNSLATGPDGTVAASDTFVVTIGGSNDPPTVSDIADQSTTEDMAKGPIAFTVGDVETPAGSLVVTAASDNQTLIPDANLVLGGSGANRTITLHPALNQSGTATITVTVSDGTASASDTLVLTVTAENDPPTISNIANQWTPEDTAKGPIAFTVGDIETAAGSLVVTASSDNQALIPNANLVLGGSGANRTITLHPALNQSGTATITVTVSDGSASASDTFVLTVGGSNDPPTVSDIADQSTPEDTAKGPIAFTVGDIETPAGSLVVTASSDNPTLIPDANLVLGGSGANRTMALHPALNQSGTAMITVTVSDGAASASDTLVLTVTAENDPPTVSDIAAQSTPEDTAKGPIAFTVGDIETPAGSLLVTANSDNP